MTAPRQGELYECTDAAWVSAPRHRPGRSVTVARGDVITVIWVEPEAEAAVPWIRDATVMTSTGVSTVSLGSLEKLIKSGTLVRVDGP